MLKIILPFLFAVNAAAGTYTTDLLLYKPAVRDTNYVAPFATGMDTLDAAIPDKRINKTATIKSTWTVTSSFTVTGASSLASATMSGPLTVASSVTVTGATGGYGLLVSSNVSLAGAVYTASGRLGVGTANPAGVSHIVGTDNYAERNADSVFPFVNHFRKSRGTLASPTIVSDGDDILRLDGDGYDSNSWANAVRIIGEVDGTPGNGDMPGRITFWTSPDGAEAVAERMRIANDGAVTVAGSAFSVGGSTLVVANGTVGIGGADTTNYPFAVKKTNQFSINPLFTSVGALNGGISLDVDEDIVIRAATAGTAGRTIQLGYYNASWKSAVEVANGSDILKLMPAGGNVGIGTTTPSSLLTVAANTGVSEMQVGGNVLPSYIYSAPSVNQAVWSTARNGSAGTFLNTAKAASSIGLGSDTSDSYIVFKTTNTNNTNNVERMRITATGNVGIGATAPTHTLQVNGSLGVVGIDASSVTVSGSGSAFTSATSTVTFAGWADFGFMTSTHTCAGVSYAQAACPSGYRAISVGCNMQTTPPKLFGLTTGTSNTCNVPIGLATIGETPTAGVCYTNTTESIDVYTHCARIK